MCGRSVFLFRHCKDLFRTQLTLRGRPISDCVGYEDEQVNYRDRTAAAAYGAWNPGLESELPREYLPLATIFRAENVSTSAAKAHELRDYCGLPPHELVAFRPERLIVHELLLRVTSSLAVPDGPDQEDLRQELSSHGFDHSRQAYCAPSHPIDGAVRAVEERRSGRHRAGARSEPLSPLGAGGRRRPPTPEPLAVPVWKAEEAATPAAENAEQRERRIMAQWSERAQGAGGRLEQVCFDALSKIATAITARSGRLLASKDLLTELAVTRVCNDYGSKVVGNAIEPFIQEAVSREGYQPLRPQERPVVMNVKGASASGKSTMRPLQRILGKEARISVGGVCADQPRYLAQVSSSTTAR